MSGIDRQRPWPTVRVPRWGDGDCFDVRADAAQLGWRGPLYVSAAAHRNICDGLWVEENGGETGLMRDLIANAFSARKRADIADPEDEHGWRQHQRREDAPHQAEAVEFVQRRTGRGNGEHHMRLVRDRDEEHGGFAHLIAMAWEADNQPNIPTVAGPMTRMRGRRTAQWGGGVFYHDAAAFERGDSALPVWISRAALDAVMDGNTGQDDIEDRWRAFLIAADRTVFHISNCGCTAYPGDPEIRWQEADYYEPEREHLREGPELPDKCQWESWFEHTWRSRGALHKRRFRLYATDMDGRGNVEYAADLFPRQED